MKLQEFQSLKTNSHFHVPFNTVWSRDNHLAVASDKGVLIVAERFSGLAKGQEVELEQWHVKARMAAPTGDCGISAEAMVQDLGLREMFLYVQDATLSPRASLSGFTPAIKSVQWSPDCFKPRITCLLGVLTDAGSLDIYQLKEMNWSVCCSLSDQWAETCRDQWKDTPPPASPDTFNTFRSRAYKIKITAFTWVRESEVRCKLLASNMVGEVIAWTIEIVDNQLKATILFNMKLDLDYATSLCSVYLDDGTLMVVAGCVRGRVQCLVLAGEPLVVKTRSLVWSDVDQLSVPPGGFLATIHPQGVLFYFPKGSHLLVLWLDPDGAVIDFHFHNTADISISGMTRLYNGDLLLSTWSGEVHLVSVDLSEDRQLMVDVCLVQASLCPSSFLCRGIASSHNSAIIALSYTVCCDYNHLAMKDISQVLLCTDTSHPLEPRHVFSHLKTDNIDRLWDCLDVIRIKSIQKNEAVKFCYTWKDQYETMGLAKLKIVMWLYQISLLGSTDEAKVEQMEAEVSTVRKLIVSKCLFKRLHKLVTLKDMSQQDKDSLVPASKWLDMVLSMEPGFPRLTASANELLTLLKPYLPVSDETCPLCSSGVAKVTEKLKMECTRGHSVLRCMNTLLPVLRSSNVCIRCGHTSLLDIDEQPCCIMCDCLLKPETVLY